MVIGNGKQSQNKKDKGGKLMFTFFQNRRHISSLFECCSLQLNRFSCCSFFSYYNDSYFRFVLHVNRFETFKLHQDDAKGDQKRRFKTPGKRK